MFTELVFKIKFLIPILNIVPIQGPKFAMTWTCRGNLTYPLGSILEIVLFFAAVILY